MRFVEIYSYSSGEEELAGRVELVEEGIQFKGLPRKFVEQILENGIVGHWGKVFFPEDGLEFLQALQYQFTGLTRASKVKEGRD